MKNKFAKKLFAAGMSLAMAAILMTGTSFAWYTVSKTPEIQNIKVKMEATKNLEIAEAINCGTTAPSEVGSQDGTDETKYGSIVTFGGANDAAQTVNFPATISDYQIKTVQYNDAGRTNGLIAASAPTDGVLTNGVGKYTASVNGATKDVAVVYGCWLRSNESITDLKMTVTPTGTTHFSIAYKVGASSNYTALSGTEVTGLSLTANTPTYVELAFYIEGEGTSGVKAADVLNGIGPDQYSIKFTSAEISS